MEKNDYGMKMEDYQFLPLRDVVFHTLRQAILKGELKPGERLMEIKLANQLGVSRTPIREAIRMLELEGLVIMVPRKGAQVAKITEKDLKDVLEVRLGLEDLATRLACQRISREQLEELCRASRNFEKLLNSDDLQALAEADVAYHDVIYKATGNPRLIQLLNNLREQMYRYRIEYLKDSKVRRSLVEEHDAIFGSIKKGDSKGAQQMIREHIERQQESIMQSMRAQNQEDH
ncbi:MAG: GntR family transcriptional regulator [Fusicatenibacter sp.]|nr:GntR family transcriptional regulator [Lachnospiraceae bacterium]MDY2937626.1 GntR family transcriptional regulator [Fusicatenibacter sp.]